MMQYAQSPLFGETIPPLNMKQVENYLKQQPRFAVQRVGDVSYIQHPFLLLRVSTSALPAWMRPDEDGSYEHWYKEVSRKEISLATYWRQLSERPVASRLQLTDQFDTVEKSKYYRLLEEPSNVRWLAHQFLSLIPNYSTLRYELLDYPHAIRLMAGPEMVAVIGERVDPEVERKVFAQRMEEELTHIAAAWRRMEEDSLKEPMPPPEPTSNAFLDMVAAKTMIPLTSTRKEENEAALRKRGIQPGEQIDDLFGAVTLPAGWCFQRINDYWTSLVDEQKRLKGKIFYKSNPENRLAWIAWSQGESR